MSGSILGSPQQNENSRFSNIEVIDPLAIIYDQGQWRVSKVSALYNLQYSTVKLKQYASKIKQAIVSVVSSNSCTNYTVTVEVESNLKYSEEDSDSLVITVGASLSDSNKKTNKIKVLYEAILLSWGVSETVPNATHLPYLLERGEQKMSTATKSSLGLMFDCYIVQFNFKQHHLLQFAFNFIESETTNFKKQMGFTFTTPMTSLKDKLTINFVIRDVLMIWNRLQEASKKSELINLTYKTLQQQIYHMFELDITTLDLCEVNLPRAFVKNNGTIKMKTPELVNSAFNVLNEISNVNLYDG